MANLAPMQRALKVVSFHRKRLSNESIGIIRESWTRFTTQFTSKVHPGPPRAMEPAGLVFDNYLIITITTKRGRLDIHRHIKM